MTVRVLGPLDVGDPSLRPRERTLLSALIVRAGAPLAPAELADALWHEQAPATWAAQVKTSVARIRSRLFIRYPAHARERARPPSRTGLDRLFAWVRTRACRHAPVAS
jgi:DNA-binding SARP family transcriptional activator